MNTDLPEMEGGWDELFDESYRLFYATAFTEERTRFEAEAAAGLARGRAGGGDPRLPVRIRPPLDRARGGGLPRLQSFAACSAAAEPSSSRQCTATASPASLHQGTGSRIPTGA